MSPPYDGLLNLKMENTQSISSFLERSAEPEFLAAGSCRMMLIFTSPWQSRGMFRFPGAILPRFPSASFPPGQNLAIIGKKIGKIAVVSLGKRG